MSLFRLSVMVAGVVFALGFLCVPLVGPPSTNGWWITALCVGSCLLVPLACVRGRAGRVTLWALALWVAVLVGWAFFTKLTEPDPRPWAARWDWPWGFLRGIVLVFVFALSAYLHSRRDRQSSMLVITPSWWESLPLADDIEEMREAGIVYARTREFGTGEDTQELLVRFLSEHGLREDRSVELDEARRLAVRALHRDMKDDREVMDETRAEVFVDEFLDAVTRDRDLVSAVFAKSPGQAGILVEAEGLGAELVVDDRELEDEEGD